MFLRAFLTLGFHVFEGILDTRVEGIIDIRVSMSFEGILVIRVSCF
jgi:hypothetical protein